MSANIDIKHVIKLAKLSFSENDAAAYETELSKILDYINVLSSADISKVQNADTLKEMDYENLIAAGVETKFELGEYRSDNISEKDASFDYVLVQENAPEFESDNPGSKFGFFLVPPIIE
jgi:aspartyl/glutamyl-tRNA(Asn/Gln) amidotransferase C subunit